MMGEKYPFTFDFSEYSDSDLVRAAKQPDHFDRDDMLALLAEVVRRWERSKRCENWN